MSLTIQFDHDLETMSDDELTALNQDMGATIDEIREYRRRITSVIDQRLTRASILAKLSAEERAALGDGSVVINAVPLMGSIKPGR